jgi:hypothetical protein
MSGKQATYAYRPLMLLPVHLCFLTLVLLGLYTSYAGFAVGGVAFGISFLAMTSFLAVFAIGVYRQFATICIDDEAISAKRFGFVLKRIPWNRIRKISKVREYDPASRTFRMNFYILEASRPQNFHLRKLLSNTPCGGILFEERIVGVQELLGSINGRVSESGAEIVEVDRERDSSLGKTLWQKMEPAEHEVKTRDLQL